MVRRLREIPATLAACGAAPDRSVCPPSHPTALATLLPMLDSSKGTGRACGSVPVGPSAWPVGRRAGLSLCVVNAAKRAHVGAASVGVVSGVMAEMSESIWSVWSDGKRPLSGPVRVGLRTVERTANGHVAGACKLHPATPAAHGAAPDRLDCPPQSSYSPDNPPTHARQRSGRGTHVPFWAS